ncbi:MAG: DNA polymerase III subunit delta [Armatimonadetes bacterium]|nr:DNA polymerase III subunit delta [Armatimonadota bacterium]MDE2207121.1 DNA polymerase III subunit delta [Armatimonadota bacterium]
MNLHQRTANFERLWQPECPRIILAWGPEEYLKAALAPALAAKTVDSDFPEFDYERLDAERDTAATILSAAMQPPMGTGRRLVVVHGVETWRDRTQAVQATTLASAIGRIPPTACLLLLVRAQNDESRRKVGVHPALDAAVAEAGAVVQFPALSEEDAALWCIRRVNALGQAMTEDAAHRLVELTGRDLWTLGNEADKAASWAGDAVVTEVAVNAVTIAAAEDVGFAFVDAVCARDTDRAMRLLHGALAFEPRAQTAAARLIALIARQLRFIWQAVHIAGQGIRADAASVPETLLQELPEDGRVTSLGWRMKQCWSQARVWNAEDIRSALELALECDLANKGGVLESHARFGLNPARNLELLVMQISQRPARLDRRAASRT